MMPFKFWLYSEVACHGELLLQKGKKYQGINEDHNHYENNKLGKWITCFSSRFKTHSVIHVALYVSVTILYIHKSTLTQ